MHFSTCGNVVSVKQLRDPETNEHKGVGFVEFEDWDGADKAVLLAIHYIKDREVEVRKARDDEYLRAVETGVVETENVGKPGKTKKLRTDPKDRSMRRVFVSSIAAAVQNGRPIWVSHKTASAMLLRKLC